MSETQEWTIGRLMEWTRGFLDRKGVEEPRLATEILLAHALDVRKIDLYARFHETVADAARLDRFRDLVRRASAGEPIAYLVGYREFFSLPFRVTPDVLIPRPETETLVGEVIHHARGRFAHEPLPEPEPGPEPGPEPAARRPAAPRLNEPPPPDLPPPPAAAPDAPPRFAGLRVLDVGTGSGAIAVALAVHLPGAAVIATDVSEPALDVARSNAQANATAVEFRLGPLYEPVADEPPFDYICSNPPYIAEAELAGLPANVRDYEPRGALAGGPDGLEVLRPLIAGAPARLAESGVLFVEVAYNQADRVVEMVEATPGLTDVRTVRDALGHHRVVVASNAPV